MIEELPDGADSFGTLGGLGRLVQEYFCVEGMHELRGNAVGSQRYLQESLEASA